MHLPWLSHILVLQDVAEIAVLALRPHAHPHHHLRVHHVVVDDLGAGKTDASRHVTELVTQSRAQHTMLTQKPCRRGKEQQVI